MSDLQQVFDFGGTTVALGSGDSLWLEYVARRFDRFHSEAAVAFHVAYDTTAGFPPVLQSPMQVYAEATRTATTPHGFTLETQTTFCDVDLIRRRALLSGPRALYPLDNLLRHLLPEVVPDALIVHGAALSDGVRGFVASGPSGSGKSTLAALVQDRALCDELTAVRINGSGPELVSLPFWKARPGTRPLNAIFLLRHGQCHELRRLSPSEAVRRLARQVSWPVLRPDSVRRCFERLGRIAEEVPVWDLAFRPTPDVWNLIAREF